MDMVGVADAVGAVDIVDAEVVELAYFRFLVSLSLCFL
jgi:hypothetical protein